MSKKKNKSVSNLLSNQEHSSDLVIKDIQTHLPQVSKQYKGMIKNINKKMPAISKTLENFYKAKSQFMEVSVDVTYLTPERQMYGLLAEIEQTKNGIEEGMLNIKKTEIMINQRRRKLLETKDDLEKEMLEARILHMEVGNKNAMKYIRGGIRKLNFFTNQYETLLKNLGKKDITEEEYEKGEIKHHIYTAMKQALHAARASGGRIDEGNYIYLFDIGVNGATAQTLLTDYLIQEEELLKEGKYPTQKMTLQFLEKCYNIFKDDVILNVKNKNFNIMDKSSLATKNTGKKNGKENT